MNSNPPPAAPDPVATATAQTASNKETAIANANLNRVDQTSPFGTSTYTVTGTNSDGTPKYAQDTQFSQPIQDMFNNYTSMTNGMGDIGNQQLAGLKDQYSKPFDLNTEAENKIAALQASRVDPSIAQQDEALRTRLINSGIREGTTAFDRATTRQGQTDNDARNSMWLAARGQGVNEAIAQRTLPLQEFNAMRTGSQVSTPTFQSVPSATQANTDVAGITQNAYNQNLAGWNAQQAQDNAFMGGLFGLGSAGLGMFKFSDRRLKTDIERIGQLPSGLPVYAYRYVWGGPRQVGVMAQEARELFPDAVADLGGFLAVDYGKVS
jgi:hypothetical protein